MRRTKEEAQATREAILDAAEDLFYENGVARTTLSHIAGGAGLTRGAIYWHFEDKLSLFRAMQERARLPQEEFFDPDHPSAARSLDALYEVTAEVFSYLKTHERSRRVMTILLFRCEYVGETAPAITRKTDADQAMHRCMVGIFEGVRDGGELRPDLDPHEAATGLICAVSGIISEWLRTGQAFDIETVGRRVLGGVIAGFACPSLEMACLDRRAAARAAGPR